MPVLLLTRSGPVHDAVVPLCAAAGVEVEVGGDPLSLATWIRADLVLVGIDLADQVVALAPPRRPDVHVVGLSPAETVFRAAVAIGAAAVVDLPDAAPWLVEALADVGERVSPGRTVGVVGGAGGAGATTLSCAFAQWHSLRAPTLLVDADPLGAGLDRLLGMEERPGVRWGGPGRHGRAPRRSSAAGGGPTARPPRRADMIGPAAAVRRADRARILPSAARGHDLVVLDLARQDPCLAELVERCDDLLVVTPTTVPALAATARLVATLGRDADAGLVVRPRGARRRRRGARDRAAGGGVRRRPARPGRLGRPRARPAHRAWPARARRAEPPGGGMSAPAVPAVPTAVLDDVRRRLAGSVGDLTPHRVAEALRASGSPVGDADRCSPCTTSCAATCSAQGRSRSCCGCPT